MSMGVFAMAYPGVDGSVVIRRARPGCTMPLGLPSWLFREPSERHKQCSRCRLYYLRSEGFAGDTSRPDGLRGDCKVCVAERDAARHAARGDELREKARLRAATPEAKEKRRRQLDRTREQRNAWSREYAKRRPDVTRAAWAKWAAKNKEHLNARKREWDAAHPESRKLQIAAYRARLRASRLHPITREQLEQRVAVFGHRCAYCGAPWEHLDHVKPLARGGPHCLANLRPACASCNHRKSSKDPFVWLASLKKKDQ